MRILLTGAGGQLGRAFQEVNAGRHDLVLAYHSRSEVPTAGIALDLEDLAQLPAAVGRSRPHFVVHAASMTNVDACEREPERAMRINGDATGILAAAARDVGAGFLYVSTDYVFDGEKGHYREEETVGPIGQYGASKLRGETLAQANHPSSIIGRTSVVYGPHKTNFVTWLIRELRGNHKVRIVKDQWVSPTLTYDLSSQILALVDGHTHGIFHTAGGERLSRLEMAQGIADVFGLDRSLIEPITTAKLNWLAKRPRDSSLDVSKVRRFHAPMDFKSSLEMLKRKLGE